MDVITDNAVWLSGLALLILVVGGLAILGLAALRLWRDARAAGRRLSAVAAELAAESDRVNASLARLPERQGEVGEAVADLQRQAAVLKVLANAASDAAAVLRAPLRYLGR